jgi:hypothetical protein
MRKLPDFKSMQQWIAAQCKVQPVMVDRHTSTPHLCAYSYNLLQLKPTSVPGAVTVLAHCVNAGSCSRVILNLQLI